MWSRKPREASFCRASAYQHHIGGDFTFHQYKHGVCRRYLYLDDEGRAYEAAGRDRFREIPFERALARVEGPLHEMGETLETVYDDAYIRRKEAVLRASGIEMLRIVVKPEERKA
jgi:hypothetical protein